MHPTLIRQLRKAGIDPESVGQDKQLALLLERIDQSYKQWDRDRALSERSLLLTSEEMASLYDRLRQQSYEQIAREEAQKNILYQAIEQAGSSILLTDADGVIEYVNAAFTTLTGYSAEEAIGRTPRILKSGKRSRSFYRKMWQSIKGGNIWHGKVIDRRKDGSLFPAMLTIAPIVDASGVITHFVGSHADLSELESLEQQFMQAQKMEAVGTLVGGIAHDFNNMLAGITGNLFLAEKSIRNAEPLSALERLSRIEALSKRAATMISQLLAFSRKGVVQKSVLSLNAFVKESLKLTEVTIPENIRLTYNISDEDLSVNGDITQLQQVLLNLLNNARDAVEGAAEPTITLELHRCVPDDAFIEKYQIRPGQAFARLTVSDNGCGIEPEHIDQVFDPFYTTKEVGKGTGLGLSMVYGALQSHGGFVDVQSEPGVSTAFSIYLPLIDQAADGEAEAESFRPMTSKGETILLADDEQCVRETTAEVLQSLGYRVLQASDGIEALALYEQHASDIALVMLDMVMPHCSGVTLARRIRSIDAQVPVIFITGYDKAHVSGDGEQVSGSHILTKPVNFEQLNSLVRQLLD